MSLSPPLASKILQHFNVRADAAEIDWVPAGAVGIIDVRSVFQQHFDDFKSPAQDGPDQRRLPVVGRVAPLNVSPFLEQILDHLHLAKGGGHFQGLVQLRFFVVGFRPFFLGRGPCRYSLLRHSTQAVMQPRFYA